MLPGCYYQAESPENSSEDLMCQSAPSGPLPLELSLQRVSSVALLVLSGWCGLISGLFEVASIVVHKELIGPNHFYAMSRHFVWLIPLINLGLFLIVGLVVLLPLHRGRAGWLTGRLLAP